MFSCGPYFSIEILNSIIANINRKRRGSLSYTPSFFLAISRLFIWAGESRKSIFDQRCTASSLLDLC